MTLIKSKINSLAWLKSAIYISVVGGVILSSKSASAVSFSPLTDTQTRGTFFMDAQGFFEDFGPQRYQLNGEYWSGVVNVTQDHQFFNDVLIISGVFQHISIPSHPEDGSTGSLFNFNLVLDADNSSDAGDTQDNYLGAQRIESYNHSEHSDSFKSLVRATTSDRLGFDRITSWTFTLEGNHTPVPEPTTIFGSALALGVGGWLKRKKSSQQNKTTSQR